MLHLKARYAALPLEVDLLRLKTCCIYIRGLNAGGQTGHLCRCSQPLVAQRRPFLHQRPHLYGSQPQKRSTRVRCWSLSLQLLCILCACIDAQYSVDKALQRALLEVVGTLLVELPTRKRAAHFVPLAQSSCSVPAGLARAEPKPYIGLKGGASPVASLPIQVCLLTAW